MRVVCHECVYACVWYVACVHIRYVHVRVVCFDGCVNCMTLTG